MDITVALMGIAAQAVAQRFIARGRAGPWVAMGALFAVLVPLTVLTGTVSIAATAGSLAVGVLVGLLLFGATQVFLRAVIGWTAFTNDVGRLYLQRSALPLTVEIPLGALVAGGEELFWRGLVVAVLTPTFGLSGAALVSLGLFLLVNALSLSRPVVTGALVGGIVWTYLAVWSPWGLLAAMACHIVWTASMVLLPPPGVGGHRLQRVDEIPPRNDAGLGQDPR